MRQLGVIDNAFVTLEHPNTPQQVGGMGIYDPSTAPEGSVRFKGVIESFERRLMKFPMFRMRLVHVPGDLDRPYWIQDANFDVEYHIRHIALPAPGDWRQLCIQVARLHARPLDMSRPLWEVYIIEGLDNMPNVPKGGFAIYSKMHHSLVDGAGGASFMAAIHDLSPEPGEEQAGDPIIVDAPPSKLQLALNTAVNQMKNTVGFARGTAKLATNLGRLALDIRSGKVPAPAISGPKTRFNSPVGPYRVFDAAEFSLDDIKLVKNTAGVKINDVVLAIVGGGMRRYLESKGELPAESLSASIPLNMRTRRGDTGENNQVGSAFVPLRTDEPDPIKRMKLIAAASLEAQKFGESSPLGDALKLPGVMAPALAKPIVKLYVDSQFGRHIPASMATVVSNVPGPDFPLFSAGAQMVRYYGLGLLTPGVGIFHLAFSSNGILSLSVLADRDIVPDPAFYKECLVEAFAEMLAATGASLTQTEAIATPVEPTLKPVKKRAPAKKKVAAKKAAARKAPAKKRAAKKPVGAPPTAKRKPSARKLSSAS